MKGIQPVATSRVKNSAETLFSLTRGYVIKKSFCSAVCIRENTELWFDVESCSTVRDNLSIYCLKMNRTDIVK